MAWLADLPRLAGRPLGGLVGGAGPFAFARVPRGTLVLPTREDADRWFRALRYFGASAHLYPADDGRPWDGVSPAAEIVRSRIVARAATSGLLVLPAKALLLRVPAVPAERTLRAGDEHDRRALTTWLTAHGYLASQHVEEPACWGARGGILDLWPIGATAPVRLEWFDDEIASIRTFDPRTQKGGTRLAEIRVLAAREATLDPAAAERAAAYLHTLGAERPLPPSERKRILQDLRNGVWFPGAEDYLPALGEVAPLRLPAPVWVVEPDAVRAELLRYDEQIRGRFEALAEEDRPLVRPFDRYLPAAEAPLEGTTPVSALVRDGAEDFGTRSTTGLKVGTGDLGPVVRQLVSWAREGRPVTLVAETTARAERLRALLEPHGLHPGTGKAARGEVAVDIGDLPEIGRAHV